MGVSRFIEIKCWFPVTSKVTSHFYLLSFLYTYSKPLRDLIYSSFSKGERRIIKEAKTQRKYLPLSPRAGSILKGFHSATFTLNFCLNPQNTHWKYIRKCTEKSHSNSFTKNHKAPSHEPFKETPRKIPLFHLPETVNSLPP